MVILDIFIWAVIQCIIAASIAGIVAIGFAILKNNATLKARKIIIKAIYKYQTDRLENEHLCGTPVIDEVDYCDMESYEKTLNRFYDWGYTRILPKDKFEIIKPFIEKE